jgi:hypothetical protein
MKIIVVLCIAICMWTSSISQAYFTERYAPYDPNIPSPESYLGHAIGDYHTRHDQIVSYLKELDRLSPRAKYIEYGKTYEGRPLSMLIIGSPTYLDDLESFRNRHLKAINGGATDTHLPLIVNMGYSVHGNEPSTSEAALLTAYTLVASQKPEVTSYLDQMIVFIDPALNPDGRERHTQWANMYRSEHLVSDSEDAEHNENWPRGRVNHYWFDLNRDWWLAIHPESRAKLDWYHSWYPHVIGDFHEMGTNSSFFFEPMKTNGSLDPIMPKENYTELNDLFSTHFIHAMDSIGSLYFTKEVFDGTYPGYGSSYGDLQGGLALLFEQASSRGHVQETPYGDMTFAFTIRNQYVAGMATLQAAQKYKSRLRTYQQEFFSSALSRGRADKVKAYKVPYGTDRNRVAAFVDKMLLHRVEVYETLDGSGILIPTEQKQYRMVQSAFETYKRYRDSVFYDASAWSLAHFYGLPFTAESTVSKGKAITHAKQCVRYDDVVRSDYAYIIDYDDIHGAAAVVALQKKGIVVATSARSMQVKTQKGNTIKTNYGAIMIPVAKQSMSSSEVFAIISEVQDLYGVVIHSIPSGYSVQGLDIGSRTVSAITAKRPLMLIGEGTSAYEAGEVWHHFDQKLGLPITKVPLHRFKSVDLHDYNTLIMVSGSYQGLDSLDAKTIAAWTKSGNTLITIAGGSSWAIRNKIVKEKLVESTKRDPKVATQRIAYDQAEERMGKESLGGVILRIDLDRTHPIGYGYTSGTLPVYKNNLVWLAPSDNEYTTVAKYSATPHIDGYISPSNMELYVKNAASVVTSQVDRGRVVLFADNPLFRGSWYGTERMFNNAFLFSDLINQPGRNFGEDDKD